jgi:glycerophosphoryl diester phosphodiesterase
MCGMRRLQCLVCARMPPVAPFPRCRGLEQCGRTWKTRITVRSRTAFPLVAPLAAAVVVTVLGCGSDGNDMESTMQGPTPTPTVTTAANLLVRQRLEALAPAANLGHRGAGVNFPDRPLAENSLSSFQAAMQQGADGVELDIVITADEQLVIMHDDTLDRTTTCTGCVSALTLEQVRACRLLTGDGQEIDEPPPTLAEMYAALPPEAPVNVELKVYDPPCRTATTGARDLARVAAAEVQRLGVAGRTVFSSFDEEAAIALKEIDVSFYVALLFSEYRRELIDRAVALGLDAIHPFHLMIPAEGVQAALDAGLQVNVWTVNARGHIISALGKGVTSIITDRPELVREVIEGRG